MWDWGTIEERQGRVMEARHLVPPSEDEKEKRPSLMIPGGARISFTAQTEKTQWSDRAAHEAEHGFVTTNLAGLQWREEAARKSMAIREGSPEPLGPGERVQVYQFPPDYCMKLTSEITTHAPRFTAQERPFFLSGWSAPQPWPAARFSG